jgi:hypothetical protein
MHIINLGRSLDLNSLEQLVSKLLIEGITEVTIKTSNLQWVEPCGIAALISYVKCLLHNGVKVYVSKQVTNGDVERYLQRVNFYRLLCIEKTEDFSRWDSTGRFVEIEIIENTGFIDSVANKVAQIFANEPELKNYMSYMTREIIANAVEHSGSGIGAVVCGQYWPGFEKAQFCVVDCGMGFRRHLSQNYQVDTDIDAIQMALEKGVCGKTVGTYGTSFNNVGYGLFVTKNIVDRNRGKLKIISGTGIFSIENGHNQKIDTLTNSWNGSIVAIELLNESLGQSYQEFMQDIWRLDAQQDIDIDIEFD